MKEASSEARNSTAAAISSGRAKRPSGCMAATARRLPSGSGSAVEQPLDHGGARGARADAVDPDAVRRVVHRHLAGELHHPALGRPVGGVGRPAEQPGDGGGVDDRPPARPHHGRQRRAGDQEDPLQAHLHHPVPVLLRGLVQRPGQLGTGVVEQHPHRPPAHFHGGHRQLHLGGAAHVRPEEERLAAGGPDEPGRLLPAGRVAVEQRHPRPLGREGQRRRPADPAPRPRHQRHPPREAPHRILLVPYAV